VGGGPAGSIFAARMAELGHDVALIERSAFPRRTLGESLSAGVMPLLAAVGVSGEVERAKFSSVRETLVSWDAASQVRIDPAARGLIVDRGVFDRILLNHAVDRGVRVLQPARLGARAWVDGRWQLNVEHGSTTERRRADYLCIATGRRARKRAAPAGTSTIAVYGYWRAEPGMACIESGADAWFWSVPLPDGNRNVLAFLDPAVLRRTEGMTLADKLRTLLASTRFCGLTADATIEGEVRAIDATPYLDPAPVSNAAISVGDVALAIDPISSSGVQKAIQGALSGAIVANTILRRGDASGAAQRFYTEHLARNAQRHGAWAASHYAAVAQQRPRPFWADRAGGAVAESSALEAPDPSASTRLGLSSLARFEDVPCLIGDFVEWRPAVSHPRLEEPLAYLGGWVVAERLRRLAPGQTPLQIARAWSDAMPLADALAIIGWLTRKALLIPVPVR
jgi:flavin-dependent dehydrogenase